VFNAFILTDEVYFLTSPPVSYLQESLEIAREIGNRWLISETLNEWGKLYLAQKQLDEACTAFDQALSIACQLNGQELIADALYGLAQIAALRGDYVEAEPKGKECQAIFEAMGHMRSAEVAQWLTRLVAGENGG
jgi:tetratricopeptide (TPR) repeat protein